jgi:hypothetical protein
MTCACRPRGTRFKLGSAQSLLSKLLSCCSHAHAALVSIKCKCKSSTLHHSLSHFHSAPPLPVSFGKLSPLLVSTEKRYQYTPWYCDAIGSLPLASRPLRTTRHIMSHHVLRHARGLRQWHSWPHSLTRGIPLPVSTEKMTCACRKGALASNSAGHDPSCRGSALHHSLSHFHSARTTRSQLGNSRHSL